MLAEKSARARVVTGFEPGSALRTALTYGSILTVHFPVDWSEFDKASDVGIRITGDGGELGQSHISLSLLPVG